MVKPPSARSSRQIAVAHHRPAPVDQRHRGKLIELHLDLRLDGPLQDVTRPAAHQLLQRQTQLSQSPLPILISSCTPAPLPRIVAHGAPLSLLLELPHGIPSHDTFGRVFSVLAPAAFEACFQAWVGAIRAVIPGEVIALDGKMLRRSHDRAAGLGSQAQVLESVERGHGRRETRRYRTLGDHSGVLRHTALTRLKQDRLAPAVIA